MADQRDQWRVADITILCTWDCWLSAGFELGVHPHRIVGRQIRDLNVAVIRATAMRVVNAMPFVRAAPTGRLSSLDLPLTTPRHAFD